VGTLCRNSDVAPPIYCIHVMCKSQFLVFHSCLLVVNVLMLDCVVNALMLDCVCLLLVNLLMLEVYYTFAIILY